jgi:general secretion pathway protein G
VCGKFAATILGMGRLKGFTVAELITVIAIVAVLASVALPLARFGYRRDKEMTLKYRLQKIADTIDRYHDLRVLGVIKAPPQFSQGAYPRTLEELTKPVELIDGKKLVFLRNSDLVDPISGHSEWRTVSSTDDVDALSSNDDNVWDLHSRSTSLSLDGKTRYSEW